MKNTIALIGRPNVGKSTFFNRLIGERVAITADEPGTTRDRKIGQCEWQGKAIDIIDTGGFETRKKTTDKFRENILSQIDCALKEAQDIFFLVDGRRDVSDEDMEIAKRLRKGNKNIFLIVNKVEHSSQEINLLKFKKLGFEKIYYVSAMTGRGIGDLLDDVFAKVTQKTKKPNKKIKVAIVGRPNVGKSSLLNKILGTERVIASDTPGTTRDTVDITFRYNNNDYVLIDTAGIRKRGKIEVGVEKFSVDRAIMAMIRSHISILVVDSFEGLTRGDAHIANMCIKKNKPLLVVFNKTDLIKDETHIPDLYRFSFVNKIDSLFISVLTGKNVTKILDWIEEKARELALIANENYQTDKQ